MDWRLSIAIVAALVIAPATGPKQTSSDACGFRDIVRAPDSPAVLDQKTWRHPDLSDILPPDHPQTITTWLRLSDAGRVTDVCIPDASDAFRQRISEVAKDLRYAPAIHGHRSV